MWDDGLHVNREGCNLLVERIESSLRQVLTLTRTLTLTLTLSLTRLPWLAPIIGGVGVDALARCMICTYFLNEGLTVMQTNPQLASILSATHLFNGDGVWQEHVAWVDTFNLVGACAALLATCNYQLLPCALTLTLTLTCNYQLLPCAGPSP